MTTASIHPDNREAAYVTAHEVICAAMAFAAPSPGSKTVVAPDWIHLLPAGGRIETWDGRGPYTVANVEALIEASMARGPLPIDQDHAINLAAPEGRPAPSRGWIVELQSRDDGLWGRVEWTDEGQRLVESRAYRSISPVMKLVEDGANRVHALARASLVNVPNLRGLTALHHRNNNQEKPMKELLDKLRKALSLADDADETQVLAAVEERGTALQQAQAAKEQAETALQAEKAKKPEKTDAGVIEALQAELKTVTEKLNSVTETTAKDKATAFVDAAIREGRLGVKPMRDEYIAMHAEDPARAEKLIGAMPILKGESGATAGAPTTDKDGKPVMTSEQLNAAKLLGVSPDAYRETLAAEAAQKEAH